MSIILAKSRSFSKITRDIVYGEQTHKNILNGIEKLTKAVASTLGPKGKNVMIEEPYGPPKVTKDGVSIAKRISFKDKFENLGAQCVIDVAKKTNDEVGDGTTTSTILTYEIYKDSLKLIMAGLDNYDIRKGSKDAIRDALKVIDEQTIKIKNSEEIRNVATVSANGDKEIGELVANAFETVTSDGVVTATAGKAFKHNLELVKGLKIDRGYISPLFANDISNIKCEYENPYVLLTSEAIRTFDDIGPILEQIISTKRPLLIVAEDITGEALATLIVNKREGTLKVTACLAPHFGDNRTQTLHDLAIFLGGKVVSKETGLNLATCNAMEVLGECEKLTMDKESTILLNGKGKKQEIEERIKLIREQLEVAEHNFEKEKLRERIGRLMSGVAVINVGGATDVEVYEKRDLIIDAINATRSAMKDGIVPGGGVALLQASKQLNNCKTGNLSYRSGYNVVINALLAPVKHIAQNAGLNGDVVVENVLNLPKGQGYDAKTNSYGDMFSKGIIDPARVVKTALLNSSSIANSLLTTNCLITSDEVENTPPPLDPNEDY